jgi:Protein of unknown function (DUF998)
MHTTIGPGTSNRLSTLASAGMGLVVVFGVCSLVMHLVQPDLSPIDDAMSYYMNGRLGWVFGLGLVALGIGSLCIAYGLHVMLASSGQRFGSLLFALWGFGAIIGGLFPPDPRGHWDEPPSLSGMIHGGAAMVAFLAFPAAAVLLSRRVRHPPVFGQTRLLTPVAWLGAASLVAFFLCLAPAIVANRPPYVLGLVERVLIMVYLIWIGAAGLVVKSAARLRSGRHPRLT